MVDPGRSDAISAGKATETQSPMTGITDILNLPATKVFKIRAQFDV